MQNWPKRNLPANKTPVGTRCIQLDIPDDDEWERIMYSESYQLSLWMLWDRDEGKNGTVVAKQWRKALQTWRHCDGTPVPPAISSIEDDIMQFRQQGCLLQVQCANGDWETIYDPTACIQAGSAQPPSQAPLTPGQCTTFHVVLQGKGQYIVPVPLNGGDSVTVSNAQGGWSDGTVLWNCPNGATYIGGDCIGGDEPVSGDPLPTSSHMRLIASVGGVYYDAYNSELLMDPTISNAQVIFQANDSDITNNNGSITFDLDVCAAPPTARWTHTFDFAASGQNGWTLVIPSGAEPDGPTGVFASDGFHSLPWHSIAYSLYYNYISVQRIYASSGKIDTVDVYYSNSTDGSSASVNAVDSDGADFYVWAYQVGGPFHQHATGLISATAGNVALVDLAGSSQASGPVGGEVVFTKIVFSGPGSDPF